MALRQNKNGTYVISSQADAVEALTLMEKKSAEVKKLMEKHGIEKRMQDATELKKAATNFMAMKNVEALELPIGKVAKLIQATKGMWIGTKDDLPDDVSAREVKTLKSLVSKEIWMKLSRRVPDPAKIEEAVSEGLVEEDEIADAYLEKANAPYVRLFDA